MGKKLGDDGGSIVEEMGALHVGGGSPRSSMRDAEFGISCRVQQIHSSSPSVKKPLEHMNGGVLFLCSVGYHLTRDM